MHNEQVQTHRRRPRWAVWAPVLALTLVLGVLVSSSQAAPAAPPYFVRGEFNGWAPIDMMFEGPPGFHWLEMPIAPDGRYEWKAADIDFVEAWPAASNSWVHVPAATIPVLFSLDTNTYMDGWWPQTGIVATSVPPTAWTAVGDWQGWDNANPATAMTDDGSGVYSLVFYVATPGPHEYKAVVTGTWDAIGADGMTTNAGTLIFDTIVPNQPVLFQVYPLMGRIRVDVLEPLLINEIRVDQPSADDDEYFELVGEPGQPLDGLTYLVIGDGTGGSGVIEAVVDLTGQAIPADGHFLATEATFSLPGSADMVTSMNFENSDNVTHLLVSGFTGANGQDLDTDDDGVLDETPWASLLDLIALVKEENPPAGTEFHYGPPQIGPDGSYPPGHVYRCPEAPGSWVIGEFDLGVDDSPGIDNICVANLAVAKLVDPQSGVLPGSTVTYTIELGNAGGAGAGMVALTDTLPVEADFVDWIGVPPMDTTMVADEITWHGPLAPSQTLVWAFTADVAGDLGATVVNTATAELDGELFQASAAFQFEEPGPPPVIVINEIMQNPAAVSDSAGEWMEVYNPGEAEVDIDGWTIKDEDTDTHLIANGGPLIVPPGGYLVLGNNTDTGTNGGIIVDYGYGTEITLANGGDEVVLLDGVMAEIDRVEYDGGPEFPDPNGASMALRSPVFDNNVGANWCTAQTPYGDGDLGTPGAQNDCPTPIVINEIMQNPAAVSDSAGEWLELYNPGLAAVDIDGWTIADNDSDTHLINNGGPLLIPAGGYLVLGNNSDPATNGGVSVGYAYSGLFLGNGADEVVLLDGAPTEIDRVEYDGGTDFPDPTGASMALRGPELDNNVGANWCTARIPYGDGDLGTPGTANDCPPSIVINEIMQDPYAVSDSSGEWLELYNAGGAPVDIDGWTIADNDSDAHLINNGGPLVIPAGGYLVLGNNADTASNGGLTVDYVYGSGWYLSNSADEVVLFDGTLFEIDRVEYDGGPAFPDPTGASMALRSPDLDNNVGANWCTASTPYGDGDLGTPGAANDCPNLVTIQQIQYVADPEVDDTSPLHGQEVVVEGVVVAEPGEIDVPTRMFVIMDPAGGPWSGLPVYRYNGFDSLVAPEGAYVRVIGTVSNYSGLTELQPASADAVQVLSLGNPIPAPMVISTTELVNAATAEQWEGVLIEFQDAYVTDPDLGYDEWAFDDGSGETRADDLGEVDGDMTYLPQDGDRYPWIRGIGWDSFGYYKLMPRYDADIELIRRELLLEKVAPAKVQPGEAFTYTLEVTNYLGFTLEDVVVVDVGLPENVTLADILDGGEMVHESFIRWTAPELADSAAVSFRFVVTAPLEMGTQIINQDTYAWASNWVTPTVGAPVMTLVGDYVPIPVIQGDDYRSDWEGFAVDTIGVVVGFFEGNSSAAGNFDGFYMQDPMGDADATTSDGIFVKYGTSVNPGVAVGDLVTVTGTVEEFSEYDGDACAGVECQTQIAIADASAVQMAGYLGAPAALELDPPGDPMAGDDYWESLEGMLVVQPLTATVVGPTNYGTAMVVAGSLGLDRVVRGGPYEGMPVGVRTYNLYGSGGPNLIVGSVVEQVDGPLAYTYGNYVVITQQGDPWTVVESMPPPDEVPFWPAAAEGQFSVATYNTYNFDTGASPTKYTKVITTIHAMNGPTFVALEEIDAAGVMPNVLAGLAALGYSYDYAASHPDVGGHGVAVMWRTDQVSDVVWSDAYQGCSPYGSSSSTYDPLWDTCQATGEYPLFSRRPVVVTGTLSYAGLDHQVVVIGNHFKSKSGGDPADDQRRLEQAGLVADLVDSFVAAGHKHVAVLGDLNDFEDSPPLLALTASGNLVNTWYELPAEARYSYIYGGVSQILDHVLVTPALLEGLEAMSPLHYNADYPYYPYATDGSVIWYSSDHDLVAATFNLPQPTVTFVYHDLENVVPDGVTIHVAGDFNGWSTTATPMMEADGTYWATVELDAAPASLTYKYIAGDSWDNGAGDILNTGNRVVPFVDGAELHDYRLITAGYAVLNGPSAVTIPLGEPTPVITGETWFSNLPFGTDQVVVAQVGYGTDPDPANWSWVDATLTGRNGNNDVFAASLTPAATGVYSYAIRFDGNWGAGNPNSAWYTGDLDGVWPGEPFELSNTGVLTVVWPGDLTASEKASDKAGQGVAPGELVTYTITLENIGDVAADVVITDVLDAFYSLHDALDLTEITTGTLGWSGVVAAGDQEVLQFVVQVAGVGSLPVGITDLTNEVWVADGVHAPFPVVDQDPPWVKVWGVYLPLVMR